MAVHKPTPPHEVTNALRAADLTPGHGAAASDAHTHAVYEISADRILTGDPAHDAVAAGWRHVTKTNKGIVAARVRTDATGAARVQEISTGPSAENTLHALQEAERLPEIASGHYELRLLTSQGLHLRLLWLKDQSGTDDRFIPIAPAPTAFQAGRSYSWRDLQQRLANRASKRARARAIGSFMATPQPQAPAPAPPPPQPPPDPTKNIVALYAAVGALVLLGFFATYLLYVVPTVSDAQWTKYMSLLGVPQAIGFAGAGWLWGREVHREQAAKAEARAITATADAAAAKADAQKQTQKLNDLVNMIQAQASGGDVPSDIGGTTLRAKNDLTVLAAIAERIRAS